jgi:putative ABC transport system permease protein
LSGRRVLVFTVGVALITGTLSALAPAWLVTHMRGLAALGRTTATWSRAPKLRGTLAVLQLALSIALLVGALLLVSTLRNLRAVDLGFDPNPVTVVGFSLDERGYDATRARAYHREVLRALQASAEFEAVSVSKREPFGPGTRVSIFPPEAETGSPLAVSANSVSDSYFRLLSIPILRGRAFTADEAAGAGDGSPLIVSETLARRLFGTIDVVGRTVRLARNAGKPERDLEIVGVARDPRWRSVAGQPDPFLYQPFGHFYSGVVDRARPGAHVVVLRHAPDPEHALRRLGSGPDGLCGRRAHPHHGGRARMRGSRMACHPCPGS